MMASRIIFLSNLALSSRLYHLSAFSRLVGYEMYRPSVVGENRTDFMLIDGKSTIKSLP